MPVESAAPKLAAGSTPNPGDPAYLKIRDLIYKTSGIYHSPGKLYLLVSSCARRMLALGIASPAAYMDRLATSATRDAELRLLLNEITIGESYMFRHPAQLDALRHVILPQILENKSAASAVRRMLDGRRAAHAGDVFAGRKRPVAGGMELRHSGHGLKRQLA